MTANNDFQEELLRYWADYAHFLIDNRVRARTYLKHILEGDVPEPMKTNLKYLLEKILGEGYNS